jgi:hypothetical protein
MNEMNINVLIRNDSAVRRLSRVFNRDVRRREAHNLPQRGVEFLQAEGDQKCAHVIEDSFTSR